METVINLNIPKLTMAVKTITVTEEAYQTLARMKQKKESFSDAILRIGKRRLLSDFFGALSAPTGERLESEMRKARVRRNKGHVARVRRIAKALQGAD